MIDIERKRRWRRWSQFPSYSHSSGRYYGIRSDGTLVAGQSIREPWTPVGDVETVSVATTATGQDDEEGDS